MHRSFFAVKDTTIISGSDLIDGTPFTDKNVGQDEVLELKKVYHNKEFQHPTRMLIQFDANEVKNYLTSSNVPGNYKLVLKLFETAGTSALSNNYTIAAYPLNESWDEGVGKEADNPKTTVGCSWLNRQNRGKDIAEITWSNAGGSYIASDEVSQSFSLSSPDIEMDVTPIAKKWFSGDNENHGFLLRFSGSDETGFEISSSVSSSIGESTIIRVDNTINTISSSFTGSLIEIQNISSSISASFTGSLFTIQTTSSSISRSISESLMRVDNLVNSISSSLTGSLIRIEHFTSSLSSSLTGSDGDGSQITYAVTVVSDGGNKYAINGATTPNLTLLSGNVYRFDQSDGTNGTHPLRFSTFQDGTHGGANRQYVGNGRVIVSSSASPGSAGAFVAISASVNTPPLYYYCTNHPGMGNDALLTTVNNTFAITQSISSSISASFTGSLIEVQNISSSISASFTGSLFTINTESSSISRSISESLVRIDNVVNTISSSLTGSLILVNNNSSSISASFTSSFDVTNHLVRTILATGEAETLKFFSRQTNTIYSPKLELRWDDHLPATGSNTGSLTPLDLSGQTENYLYQLHSREAYKETETIKFRFGARKRYIDKSFSTSIQSVSGSYFAEGSASYSIIDMATNEDVVPFSAYTTMSCDPISPYFIQDLNGFEPNRAYKILVMVKHNDNQTLIYDDDFEFILRS